MIKVTGYRYVQGTPGYLKQGVKNHRTPRGAVNGGNGSFIMKGEPAKAFLSWNVDGEPAEKNIYPFIKDNTTRSRVTEKYVGDVCSKLIGCEFEDMKALSNAIFKNL